VEIKPENIDISHGIGKWDRDEQAVITTEDTNQLS